MNERYAPTICPICNKEFRPEYYARWGWVIGTESAPIPVCSYKCQRQWEKNPKKKQNPAREPIPVRIIETGEAFRSMSDCAAALDTSIQIIHRCIHQGKKCKGLHIERVVG